MTILLGASDPIAQSLIITSLFILTFYPYFLSSLFILTSILPSTFTMACYRPVYPTATHAPDCRPTTRPRSPVRRSHNSLPVEIGGADSPWTFNPGTGDVLLSGRIISTWERNLAVLATRYPAKYSQGGSYYESFDKKDHELLLVVKKHPLDLSEVNHSPESRVRPAQAKVQATAPVPSTPPTDSTASTSDTQPSAMAPTATTKTTPTQNKSKPLPQIPQDRSPWSYDPGTGGILVAGEPLTGFERIIVIQVSRYPNVFKDYGSFVREGEKPLSNWERQLVNAARKFPVNLKPIADWYPDFVTPANQAQTQPQSRPAPNPAQRARELSANDAAPSSRTSSSKAFWDKSTHRNLRTIPLSSGPYNRSHEDFRSTKKRILSNAHAYYARCFPKAERYD